MPAAATALRETLLIGVLSGVGGALLAAASQNYSRHWGSLLSPELTFQIGHIHRVHAFAGFQWGAMVSCLAGVAWRGWRRGGHGAGAPVWSGR